MSILDARGTKGENDEVFGKAVEGLAGRPDKLGHVKHTF